MPARLGPGAVLDAGPLALPGPVTGREAFWLAVALRQHLWRGWRDVRGFQPVIGVRLEGSAWAGGIALGAAPAPPGFDLGPMLTWAHARVRN